MIIQLTIFIAAQILFNIINASFDAYRIAWLNKTVSHALNFGMYAVIVGVQIYLGHFVWWYAVIFCLQAFFNRQNFFDIPLNLRRSKKDKSITWDYISKAKPPKAWWDRQEIKVFGYNGKAIAISYMILWALSTGVLYIIQIKFL